MAQTLFRSDDTAKWIYRYGNGSDGAYSSAGNATHSCANASFSGTSGAYTITLGAASTFANGDIVFLHQTRGTGAGTCMFNYVVSGGGTTTLTLAMPLVGTFTDSGASQAQIVECKQYSSFTQNAGHTLTATAWGGDTGGIIPIFANQYVTIAGTITATGKGFRGSTSHSNGGGVTQWAGEGSANASVQQKTANGNGGGGGDNETTQGANNQLHGSGGGNGTVGTRGAYNWSNPGVGEGGAISGNAGLTSISFGGGGGSSGGYWDSNGQADGGNGGGIIIIISPIITITGSLISNGVLGQQNGNIGGSGASGSILLKCKTATLGTNLVQASAITDNRQYENGVVGSWGSGGAGRIHIDYASSYTGTTTPTIDTRIDKSLGNIHNGGII